MQAGNLYGSRLLDTRLGLIWLEISTDVYPVTLPSQTSEQRAQGQVHNGSGISAHSSVQTDICRVRLVPLPEGEVRSGRQTPLRKVPTGTSGMPI